MKKLKRLINIFFILFIIFLAVVSINMHAYPDEVSQFLGYRFYVVLTQSMEPKIPTFSLVFSKTMNREENIKPDTIVTFKAKRGSDDILLTHYYRDMKEENGEVYYRTQPEGITDQYDPYNTQRSDIIGEYIFHIPFVGKIILFFQGPFGYILLAEWVVIWLVNKTIKVLWEEKNKKKLQSA